MHLQILRYPISYQHQSWCRQQQAYLTSTLPTFVMQETACENAIDRVHGTRCCFSNLCLFSECKRTLHVLTETRGFPRDKDTVSLTNYLPPPLHDTSVFSLTRYFSIQSSTSVSWCKQDDRARSCCARVWIHRDLYLTCHVSRLCTRKFPLSFNLQTRFLKLNAWYFQTPFWIMSHPIAYDCIQTDLTILRPLQNRLRLA